MQPQAERAAVERDAARDALCALHAELAEAARMQLEVDTAWRRAEQELERSRRGELDAMEVGRGAQEAEAEARVEAEVARQEAAARQEAWLEARHAAEAAQ
eukprot:scaffold71295_cov30-Phaeocystis_antarctica.AAC.1